MNQLIRSKPYYKGLNRSRQSPTHTTKLIYTEGEIVEADTLNDDPNQSCGAGINFCLTLAGALKYGPLVVEVTVPDGEVIIDAGDKLRASRVVVGKTVDLGGAYLGGAYLRDADLRDADLCDARVNDSTTIDLRDGWKIESGVIVRDA